MMARQEKADKNVRAIGGKRKLIGQADVFYHNEHEQEKFSKSEVIAEAFDVRQEEKHG